MTLQQDKKRREAPPVSDDDVGIKVLRETPEDASYPIEYVTRTAFLDNRYSSPLVSLQSMAWVHIQISPGRRQLP